MTDEKLMEKLGDYVEDAHAMETSTLQLLESLISTTPDEKIRRDFERHKRETEEQEQRLRDRLEAFGRRRSVRKQAETLVTSLVKGVGDQMRGDKAGKNARDAFVTEHVEIAAYELLERLALLAGDADTALVARQNKQEEQRMADKIASNWSRFLALTLVDAGIEIPAPRRRRRAASGRRSDGKSKEDLYEEAKRLRVPGRSTMSKEQLARAIAARR